MGQTNPPLIWVLLDEVAGHMNQALGVVEALNTPYEAKTLKYTKAAKWPNFLRYASLKGLTPESQSIIKAPWPDLVISAGRKTAPVAQYIKKQSGGKTLTCHIMNPGFPACGFDLVVVPEHDGRKANANRMVTTGAPNRVQPDFLLQEAAIWQRTLEQYPRPRVAVMLGGDTKGIAFTAKDGEALAEQLNALNQGQGSLLISSSRRTPKAFLDALQSKISQPHYLHEPGKSRTNPYYAFISLADAVVVTADSVSMVSEACSSGRPVYLYKPFQFKAHKHERFLFSVKSHGFAKELAGAGALTPSSYVPKLEASQSVAAKLQEMLANRGN